MKYIWMSFFFKQLKTFKIATTLTKSLCKPEIVKLNIYETVIIMNNCLIIIFKNNERILKWNKLVRIIKQVKNIQNDLTISFNKRIFNFRMQFTSNLIYHLNQLENN